jgi:hypothetical protein
MALNVYQSTLAATLLALSGTAAYTQVFVVGEKSATASVDTTFKPSDLPLPNEKMTERGRRELIRNLEAEQGFAHRSLPLGASLTLRANGPLSQNPSEYKKMLYEKGEAAGPGDRVVVTAMEIKENRIVIDVNGGPYLKHRFLRHVSINDAPVTQNTEDHATGSRITLVFEGYLPELSAAEVKSLLAPVIDFGVKTTEQAYADTLPATIKESVAAHEVLVGMNHRMVLAALGAPENKIRDQPTGDQNGGRCEEWIYGHVPQTVRFVRFVGDRVTVVEIAALGKPLEIHDKDEMGDFNPPMPTREIALGDRRPDGQQAATPPPTLRKPGESVPAGGENKVQFPTNSKPSPIPTPPNTAPSSNLATNLPPM